jgi:hypothetical protein
MLKIKKNGGLALTLMSIILTSLFLLVFPPHRASAAIAFDKNLGGNLGTTCTSSVAFTTTQAAAINSKLIITIGVYASGSANTITVSGGGLTWHTDKSSINLDGANDQVAIASADAVSGLSSGTTITASFSATASDFCYIGGTSFTGINPGTTYDGTNNAGPTASASWNGGAISTTNANDLIFGLGVIAPSLWSLSCTASTNYTSIHCAKYDGGASGIAGWHDVYRIVSSTTAYTAGGTFNSASGPNSGGISIAYKASAASSSPAAPTLTSPSSGAINVLITPSFTMSTTDVNGDTIKYRIYLFLSDCSTPVGSSPFAQSTTPAGWDNGSTAYTSGATATYTYQGTLSFSTTYCWQADAVDPGGTAVYGTASGTNTFTTAATDYQPVNIKGNVNINGNVNIK